MLVPPDCDRCRKNDPRTLELPDDAVVGSRVDDRVWLCEVVLIISSRLAVGIERPRESSSL
jgi:hypothetical protein